MSGATEVDRLHGIWQWAKREADAGAPGGMVAVYVELAVRHLIDDHIGHASSCTECHNNLGTPVPTARSTPTAETPTTEVPSD